MKTKILIADDSATDRLIIENMLKDFDVITATNGKEALRIIEDDNDIELLILDLNMPEMDGFEVLRELKLKDKLKRIRTLILTNYDELENEIKGLKLGAIDYIRKPVNMESLRVRIDTHLELLRIQRLFEQQLQTEYLTLQTLLDQSPIGIAIVSRYDLMSENKVDDIMTANQALVKLSGYSVETLRNTGFQKLVHPEEINVILNGFKRLESQQEESFSIETRFIRNNGVILWVNAVVAKLDIKNRYKYNYIYLIQDITKRKTAEHELFESERSKTILLDNLPGMMFRCKFEPFLSMLYVSNGCLDLTGYSANEMMDNSLSLFTKMIKPEYHENIWQRWQKNINEKKKFTEEFEILTATNESKWVWVQGQAIYDEHGNVICLEGLIIDITERKENERKLKYLSEHNNVTNIANVLSLENVIKRYYQTSYSKNLAMIMIFVRRYDHISRNFGYRFGQSLLISIGDVLKKMDDDKHILFHPFSDRFVFIVEDYQEITEVSAFVEAMIKKLSEEIKQKSIGFSIGIMPINLSDKYDVNTLLRLVASATDRSTDKDHINYSFYDKSIAERNVRERQIIESIDQYILDNSSGNLYLLYQAIVDVKTNKIVGFEALVRYNDNKLGVISPVEFIPIIESSFLIMPIGKIIIEKASSFAQKLAKSGYKDISVSINVSAIQLLNDNFIDGLINQLEHYDLDPSLIHLEVTESIFFDNYQEINRKLNELRTIGIKVAIDDFGTGYSSLAREEELSINCLKIDKYFLDKLFTSDPQRATLSDIISMAHKLGHCVVAEGVEKQAQLDYLLKHNCDMYQGYLFSKPILEEDALKLLDQTNKKSG